MSTIKADADFNHPFYNEICTRLAGRDLLLEEIGEPLEILLPFLQAGHVVMRPGLSKSKKSWLCHRCLESDPGLFAAFSCARCGQTCTYCRICLEMGRIDTCGVLFSWNGRAPLPEGSASLQWQGELSSGQQKASDELCRAIANGTELLIWAVCGAGKTEILFRGIEDACLDRRRVLLTTPRADVVMELLPRIRAAFPGLIVKGLYGGSEERFGYADIHIATTHQTRRFRDAFDVVIIDEIDAFPFSYDPSLKQAVDKAAKPGAARIYLTATPSRQLKKQARDGELPFIQIPRRYHDYPLPVPTLKWIGNWKKALKKDRMPPALLAWCEKKTAAGVPVFVFVSSVEQAETAARLLAEKWEGTIGVHAADPLRHEKIQLFRDKKVPILVTTTILERGVTIKGAEAAVLGAEENIFDEKALVQIAGRVGRSSDQPDGDVMYFHYGKTTAMLEAVRHIQTMNKQGGTAHGE
ncbi:DEAD/DEAH box helicase [Sinobaca sp. H24]|uniref:DEAD/DEAH box helicase n=1 Tax=Sinobaca sp. H24 TaxID=2923376 RepID=UPI002079B530|nr:DEAD/DEAH box helicase family protein [Sinobaca sp. H24]